MTFTKRQRWIEGFIHSIGWLIMFGFPFFFFGDRGDHTFSWASYLSKCVFPMAFMMAFYINYSILIPRLYFQHKEKAFYLVNILLIIVIAALMHYWMELGDPGRINRPPHGPSQNSVTLFFAVRNGFTLILTIMLSVAIRIIERWNNAEKERQEFEKTRTEAELKNLRNQLNPHFLLNTLNNIYALIAFSPDQAQQAVLELSKLLRYVLYENNTPYVPLSKEVDFLANYIELMRIRLSDNVKLEFDFSSQLNNTTPIAPLLLITMVENAFKHGVSATAPSYIRMKLDEESGIITFTQENTLFPKNNTDKSGSGIGIDHMKRRLELLYPQSYTWVEKRENNKYYSQLVINTNGIIR